MWGATSCNRLDVLHCINGNLTAEEYKDIMDFVLIPYAHEGPFPDGLYLFQHDFSLVHTAKRVKQLLFQCGVQLLKWLSKGADLNIIEHLWARLKKRLRKISLNSASPDALRNAVATEWKCLKEDKAFVGALYLSMPSCIEAVTAIEGGMTRH
ncbi:hypothetical protein HPB50_023685 [Hyalomma asiaticum]|uniref:Uncharacterized protein n=1 Tax=Hyalomma asiaticum TaxID=266040 RepID=A0ACB7T6V0_HYAAI|nr:hypothetical protein HPB50_023685 [Hyalomma asiaticum]